MNMIWRALPFALATAALLLGFRPSESPTKIDAELIRTGLAAWNKSDAKGRSCVGCHSPQGLELAFYDFGDDTIIRRAEAHVSPVEAQAIVGMVHARRREYKIYKPLDAMADRSLQPGGEVLPGDTAADRDFAFAREIDRRVPLLTRKAVDSLKMAKEERHRNAARTDPKGFCPRRTVARLKGTPTLPQGPTYMALLRL